MSFQPTVGPYDPRDKKGYGHTSQSCCVNLWISKSRIHFYKIFRITSYETVVKRWPVIITGVIDQLYNACHALSLDAQKPGPDQQTQQDRISEAKGIIEKLSKLKYQMGRDHPLEPLKEDGECLVDVYNHELEVLASEGNGTWFTAPWLYAECYLYRLLRSFFVTTTHWKNYDPFEKQKTSTFAGSGTSILKIASSIRELEIESDLLDEEKVHILFREMVQMCLWGNATDLSLLTHLTPSEIGHLQTVGKEAQKARSEFILRDDQKSLWEHVRTLKGGRVDFVLDNAGFEVLLLAHQWGSLADTPSKLFTDLVFADFLVTRTPYVSKVYFHPKLIPWFVSDVTPPDFSATMELLLNPSFFPRPTGGEETEFTKGLENLFHMVKRWQSHLENGTFNLSVPDDTPLGGNAISKKAYFWTGPWPYWNLESLAPELFSHFQESDLVVFKGDLNYRKLTGDVKWPAWTPFNEAIGPLAGSFPVLSLRTNKADVIVGVDKDIANRFDKEGNAWRTSGKYGLITFLNKYLE